MSPAQTLAPVTGLVLAGGQGTRMGGQDKGWALYSGRPLIDWSLERLASQVSGLLISANRNLERYQAFGYPVLTDIVAGYSGPLAGLHTGLTHCTTPLLCCVPCDTPHFPEDLVDRLRGAMDTQASAAAWAVTDEGEHPVFLVCKKELTADLGKYLTQGGRRVREWLKRVDAVPVRFPDEAAFANFNTAEALAKAAEG